MCVVVSAGMMLAVSPALAAPMEVESRNASSQDMLFPRVIVHEMGGSPLFPPDEWIISDSVTPEYKPYFENSDEQGISNMLVSITDNHGIVNGGLESNLVNFGENKPSVFESLVLDSIFQIGAIWELVVRDYSAALILQPLQFGTISVELFGGDDITSLAPL